MADTYLMGWIISLFLFIIVKGDFFYSLLTKKSVYAFVVFNVEMDGLSTVSTDGAV